MRWLANLKSMREKASMSYREISLRSGIPYSTIEKLFSGRTKDPKLGMINSIVQCMGGDINDLICAESSSLREGEPELLEMFRMLDSRGRELVTSILQHECDRIKLERRMKPEKRASMIYYDFPVSAGTGEFMDVSNAEIVSLDDTPPNGAEFLLRVSGDSMEPELSSGDIVYVQRAERINFGETGIFSYAGSVYIKVYTEQGLKSHNPRYPLIKGNEDIKCLGRVLGKVSGGIVMQ